jgi:hypothetical protein
LLIVRYCGRQAVEVLAGSGALSLLSDCAAQVQTPRIPWFLFATLAS